jgi:quercetin dioxygenase-like cupin family protein
VLLNGEEIARVADLFGQKFPRLAPGATMSISFFRVTPTDLQFIDNSESGGAAPEGVFGAEFHKDRSYSVFSDLPSLGGAGTVAAHLQRVDADAGEVIAREGGPADKFLIVVEGEVEVTGEGGAEKLGPGQLVGDVAIMRDTPRTATVTATKQSVLLTLDRDGFRTLVAESLGTTDDFVRIIQDRLGA